MLRRNDHFLFFSVEIWKFCFAADVYESSLILSVWFFAFALTSFATKKKQVEYSLPDGRRKQTSFRISVSVTI